MTSVDTLELVSQDQGLIKSTPTEETIKKIIQMQVANIRANNDDLTSWMTVHTLVYVIKYLRRRYDLSDDQIINLSSEDLNRMPEIIFADRGKWILLLGWVPIFGWIFAGKYLVFKNRVKYLRSLDETIFDKDLIKQIM